MATDLQADHNAEVRAFEPRRPPRIIDSRESRGQLLHLPRSPTAAPSARAGRQSYDYGLTGLAETVLHANFRAMQAALRLSNQFGLLQFQQRMARAYTEAVLGVSLGVVSSMAHILVQAMHLEAGPDEGKSRQPKAPGRTLAPYPAAAE